MDSETKEVFDKLYEDPANKLCFECGAPSSAWASVSNGIFLCLNCSGLHRGFGVHISFVRSVNMDAWTEKQIEMMRKGGNKRLRDFFDKYMISKDAPIDFKYKTKAGVYYRENLKAEAEGRETTAPPSIEEGLELTVTTNSNLSMGNLQGIKSNSSQEDKNGLDEVLSILGTFGNKAIESSKIVANKTIEKVTDPNFKEQVKSVGTGILDGAKDIGTSVYAGAKDLGGKALEGTKELYSDVKAKSDEKGGFVNLAVAAGNSGLDTAKKGVSSVWSFFKKQTGLADTEESKSDQ